MPFTISHALAILPFRRHCPRWLNFAALVIGSMSPDFGYFSALFPMATLAHSAAGTFVICLPSGLLALALFYLLRRPLCFMLPQPHRGALMPLASTPAPIHLRGILIAAVSILIGAWTHTLLDSFTHDGGWFVQRIPFLRAPLLQVGGTQLRTFNILQHLGTVGGGALLALLYLLWLRRRPARPSASPDSFPDRWRYLLIGALVIITLAIATPAALSKTSAHEGFMAVRVFMFRVCVHSIAIFSPLLVICSLILYLRWQSRISSESPPPAPAAPATPDRA